MSVRPTSVGRAKIEVSHGLGTVAQVQWRLVHDPHISSQRHLNGHTFQYDLIYPFQEDVGNVLSMDSYPSSVSLVDLRRVSSPLTIEKSHNESNKLLHYTTTL